MTRLIRALLVSTLFFIVLPAAAQDDPTTPDIPSFVVDWSHDLMFPEGVRFQLALEIPRTELIAISIEIEAEGDPARTINIDLDEDLEIAPTFVVLDYLWEIPDDQPPPLLSTVSYTMRVITQSEQAISLSDRFTYAQPDYTWLQDDDPLGRLNLLYIDGSYTPATIRNNFNLLYDYLQTQVSAQPTYSFLLIHPDFPLEPTCEVPGNAEGDTPQVFAADRGRSLPCEGEILNNAIARLPYAPLDANNRQNIGVVVALDAILFDDFYSPIWQGRDLPLWFREGFKAFILPRGSAGWVSTSRNSVRADNIYTLEQMDQADFVDDAAWQGQAATMVLYLADQAGVPAVLELARDGGGGIPGETFVQSYTRLIAQSIDALIPSWSNWVFRSAASDAEGLNLLAGPTPSPTPSRTASPFPATATNTPTNTPTATITPTVTGVLTATPLATRRPTRTPDSGPASATPQPFGAVQTRAAEFTATAIALMPPPVEAESSTIDTDIALPIVGGIFAVLIVLIGVALWRTNR